MGHNWPEKSLPGTGSTADAFSGMAPGSQLVIVKLKEAKENLKEYYGIAPDMLAPFRPLIL